MVLIQLKDIKYYQIIHFTLLLKKIFEYKPRLKL